jgi:alpha-beta hydrolase superfamily lysophospholipase
MASKVAPRLSLPTGIPAADLSHERSVVTGYDSDRWVHKVATARWFTEATAAQRYCVEHADRLALPLLVVAAGDDRIADLGASRRFFDGVRREDKKMIVYPGFFHEVMNEVGREQVFEDIVEWLGGLAG